MRRVAVVEDNPDNRLLVRAILQEHYEVAEFASGADALESFTTNPPDVVLLDISLPGMDGQEILDRMRSYPQMQGIPVIAFTAHAMEGDREAYLAAGFDGYVTKPIVDENDLLTAISRCLDA
jgi:CheY-like chemotaxis protein